MANFGKIMLARRWRWPKVLVVLFCVEFPLTVAMLTLFGIADPDTYRTKLWQNGYDKGFNSPPSIILYRPIPTPVVWSNYTTQFNIVVSVLSMFILLLKSVMFIMHAWLPVLSLIISIVEVSIYSVSLSNQGHPDLSDPTHPARGLPWMLSKGCSYAYPSNYGYCMQARASYAVTCVMIVLFSVYVIYSAWNVIPTTQERAEREADRNAMRELEIEMKQYADDPNETAEQRWAKSREIILNLPKTPNTPGFALNPMTPRTTAFTKLNGGGQGDQGLPFRQQYGGK